MRNAYYARTIHLTADPDDLIAAALCGQRLLGAIDTEASATCPTCHRLAAEQEDASRRAALSDAYPENLAAPRAAYPASVGGGAKIHAALLPTPPEGDGADLGAATIACGAGRRSFTAVGYSFAPTIRSRPSQAIDCASCLRSTAARYTPLGEPAAQPEPAARPPFSAAAITRTIKQAGIDLFSSRLIAPGLIRAEQRYVATGALAASDTRSRRERRATMAAEALTKAGYHVTRLADTLTITENPEPEEAGPPCSHCGGPTISPSRPGEEGNYCPACGTAWTDTVAVQPEALPEQQSPTHQRAIIEALPMLPAEGSGHVRTALAEADRATSSSEPRELIGTEARYLRPGDIIVAAGCQHRDWRGCDHRLYAAFDLLLQDGEHGERMTIWTAIADQEAGQPPRLTLPAGQRLLVQRRLPDWKIAEAPSFAAAIIDLAMPELLMLCGPAGNLERGGDLNSTWTCARAHGLWGMHRRQAELAEELDRLPRLRSPRRRAALADWIARAFVRYEALNRSYLGRLPACTHPEGMRQEMSVEEALPPCTC